MTPTIVQKAAAALTALRGMDAETSGPAQVLRQRLGRVGQDWPLGAAGLPRHSKEAAVNGQAMATPRVGVSSVSKASTS
jgi:hypothetical protein